MSITDKMWDGITRVIRLDGKVERLASTVVEQQKRIEDLTARVIRLEARLDTYVEVATATRKQLPEQ
jgi:hypothetical protein